MKKILMAILAAVTTMNLALAMDIQSEQSGLGESVNIVTESPSGLVQTMGISETYTIAPGSITINDTTRDITSEVLGELISKNLIMTDVTVSSGKDRLSKSPKVTVKNGKTLVSIAFKDRWGTDESTATMRVRITAKKDIYTDGTAVLGTKEDVNPDANILWLGKGDTITLDTFTITASYWPITSYGESMTITNSEVNGRFVLAGGDELFNSANSKDNVMFYFTDGGKDVAAYEVKINSNQKDVNLAFNTDDIDTFVRDYDGIEFEFITFEAYKANSGANRFNGGGTLYFNAIGGSDTVVYEVVNGGLSVLNTKYDAIDDTVAVSGIHYLTQYVVASEAIVSTEKEEPAEVSSSSVQAPVEKPSTPVMNPATGAM